MQLSIVLSTLHDRVNIVQSLATVDLAAESLLLKRRVAAIGVVLSLIGN